MSSYSSEEIVRWALALLLVWGAAVVMFALWRARSTQFDPLAAEEPHQHHHDHDDDDTTSHPPSGQQKGSGHHSVKPH